MIPLLINFTLPLIVSETMADNIYGARDKFYTSQGDKIKTVIDELIRQDSIYGKNNQKCKLLQYNLAFNLGRIIRKDIDETCNDWEYYNTKYSISTKVNNLICSGVDLKTILESFNIPIDSTKDEWVNKEYTYTLEIPT